MFNYVCYYHCSYFGYFILTGYSKMSPIFFVVIILTNVAFSWCENCSDIYLRYSNEHTFCTPKNLECSISYSGVTPENIQEILDIHNEYRNYVATGQEKQAGSLPKAGDMLLMVRNQ